MDSSLSTVPIQNQELASFNERANRLLMSAKWTGKSFSEQAPQQPAGTIAWRDTTTAPQQQEELSLLQACKVLGNDPLLLPAALNQALRSVRQGLCIGMHLSKLYTKFSGLDQLVTLNAKGALAELQKVEFRNKYQTASAIAVFGSAYSLLWELSQYRADELNNLRLDIPALPEVSLQDPVRALDCYIFYLTALVQKSGVVKNELECVKAIMLYAEAVVNEIRRRADSFTYTEPFTGQVYQLEGSEFRVNGFSAELAGKFASVEFNRVKLDEIVGNREAKHQARRVVSRLLCYDPQAKKNPMYDLGGLAPITLGFGEPGTGKSLLISAIASMLDEHCQALGLPFLFWPMPDTIVSTYQGGSAERMMSWMSALKDPTKIIYAPIDDAENNLEDRSRQGVSAGVREVIAVFLRNTEGAYAVHRGNSLIQLFTNLPDQIDKAVMSRINDRAYIAGAVLREDFLDQDYLWYRKYEKIDPKFVNLSAPKDYALLTRQAEMHSLSEVSANVREPKEPRVKSIFDAVLKNYSPKSHDFYAQLFAQTKKEFPFFTSRDVRNIQRAIDARALDFDLPGAWFEDPELFFKRDYESKRAMLIEQMKQNLGGLSFGDIRFEETIRYLDSMATIADSGRERKVGQLVEDFELQTEARRRFNEAYRE
ncbi:MAG: AAA family ATPase [Bdellovibrionota bacterium]